MFRTIPTLLPFLALIFGLAACSTPAQANPPSPLQPVGREVDLPTPDPTRLATLQEKIASVAPDGDGSVTITISDDELTQNIAKIQDVFSDRGADPIVQNPMFDFKSGQIYFSGSIESEQFTGDLEILFAPFLVDNVLQLDLISATVNGKPIPAQLLQPVEDSLNAGLQEIFSQLPPAISLDEVTVQDGFLIITGSVTPEPSS